MNEYIEYLISQLPDISWEYFTKDGSGGFTFELPEGEGCIAGGYDRNGCDKNTIYIYSGLGAETSYGYPVVLKSKEQVDALLIGLGDIKEIKDE